MNEPVLYKPRWTVWTNDSVYAPDQTPRWCWAAYGPRGSQSGIETTGEEAVRKAAAASYVLDDSGQR